MGTIVQGDLERAMRFPVRMPVRYRLPRTQQWFESQTENASRTGLLIQGEVDLKPSTIVDVRLEVPSTQRNGESAEVVCKCEVVRKDTRRGNNSPVTAVAIQTYKFRRRHPGK